VIRLIQGDCLDAMKEIKARSVDMILTDPPYGTTACKWDSIIPFAPMWAELGRIRRKSAAVVLMASQPFTSALIMSNPDEFKYCWIWNKKKGGNIFNLKSQPYKIHEDVTVFFATRDSYHPLMTDQPKRTGRTYGIGEAIGGGDYGDERVYTQKYPKSIIEISNANQRGKTHPTQKPVALMEYLIKTYTNEGDTVLDFTMGSGTTGVACKNLSRDFIGIELDDDYFRIAQERIRTASG